MTPTAFEFTVKMPGDARLVSAITQLTTHAAGYAQLTEAAGDELARDVQEASDTAVAAQAPTIDFRFNGDTDMVTIVISFVATTDAPTPPSTSSGRTSVEWSAEGHRRTCHIRQRLSA